MNSKKALKFLIIFVITFTVLFVPFSGFRSFYRNVFIGTGMALYQNFGDKGAVLLQPQKDDVSFIKVYIANKDTKQNGKYTGSHYDFNIFLAGLFLPAIFFISIVAALSLSWKRRTAALLAGFMLILVYAMVKLRICILYYYSINAWSGIYQSTDEKASISSWYSLVALHETPEFTFVSVSPAFFMYRKKEWEYLNGSFEKVVVKKKLKTAR